MRQDAGCWAWQLCNTDEQKIKSYDRAEVQIHRSWGGLKVHMDGAVPLFVGQLTTATSKRFLRP